MRHNKQNFAWYCTKKLQNFAAKVAVGGARKYDHVSHIVKELQWLWVEQNLFDTHTTVYKALMGYCPDWVVSFTTVNEATGSVIWQNENLYVPRTRIYTGAKAQAVLGPKLWNTYPIHMTAAYTLPVFNSRLKAQILNVAWRDLFVVHKLVLASVS